MQVLLGSINNKLQTFTFNLIEVIAPVKQELPTYKYIKKIAIKRINLDSANKYFYDKYSKPRTGKVYVIELLNIK